MEKNKTSAIVWAVLILFAVGAIWLALSVYNSDTTVPEGTYKIEVEEKAEIISKELHDKIMNDCNGGECKG